jgi:hypothetical protein
VIINLKIPIQHQDWFFIALTLAFLSFRPDIPNRNCGFAGQFSHLMPFKEFFPRLFEYKNPVKFRE